MNFIRPGALLIKSGEQLNPAVAIDEMLAQ